MKVRAPSGQLQVAAASLIEKDERRPSRKKNRIDLCGSNKLDWTYTLAQRAAKLCTAVVSEEIATSLRCLACGSATIDPRDNY